MASHEEAKLETFLQWLQANGVELRGCKIKYSDETKGFGIFSSIDTPDGVLLVVPLDLAITPMRVLQDPLLGPECRAMFEEGEVDDRFLMILFLTVERLRKDSLWKPYLDMLPTTFGNPLWFTDDELLELKGTSLYRATKLQKKTLVSLFEDKVKGLVEKLLSVVGDSKRAVCFEDFLWANSVFWARALNIPFPHSYVFPKFQEDQDGCCSSLKNSAGVSDNHKPEVEVYAIKSNDKASTSTDTVWVEGLVPGIDFCNHDIKVAATWEVDGTGITTGVPLSMYLLSVERTLFQTEKEISISYGNKGNEELLYLYGFVIENNPDDYLMVHYPVEAIPNVPFPDAKGQLLEAQKAELRCLLPKSLLDRGFFPASIPNNGCSDKCMTDKISNFSWSGQRKMPSYLNKLVFPEEFLTALRTIAMKEDELFKVSSLLEEGERQPSDAEVRSAVWEACGDSGALQLLVDLLHKKIMDLEESCGLEDCDSETLEEPNSAISLEQHQSGETGGSIQHKMSRNRWSNIVYRRGQKRLAHLFLREAEHALQLALSEGS
ncbi:uncharacterized protein LOC120003395 isoform X3 [Tripterygium wilfordii]|uniref:uncharacterized protein LOC120003395 isoform X3 n=1 Tax=Tripterygium wilfordii TaxID=458696 RepID=UPI0018F82924|nr:uncharacterized protein LOC120003395 isoform X3 [Tripterygium wilfordii]